MFALAPELLTQSTAPVEPRLNGAEPLDSKTHVDDATRAEVYVGYRPFLSGREYNKDAVRVFGKGAIHAKKQRDEGGGLTADEDRRQQLIDDQYGIDDDQIVFTRPEEIFGAFVGAAGEEG